MAAAVGVASAVGAMAGAATVDVTLVGIGEGFGKGFGSTLLGAAATFAPMPMKPLDAGHARLPVAWLALLDGASMTQPV